MKKAARCSRFCGPRIKPSAANCTGEDRGRKGMCVPKVKEF